jgi:TM2 domain-containing membrane protein YozV
MTQCNSCARPLCQACDHRIRGFAFCQDCIVAGVDALRFRQSQPTGQQVIRRKTSPFIATFLSLFVPGLGAAYNGQTSKAIVHFAIFASFFQMAVITDGGAFFVLGVAGMWLFAAVDACRTAQLTRAGLAPDAEEDAITRQLYGNPVAWGITLLVLGGLFLSRTVLGVQFPVKRALPVALVVLGAYILYDYLKRHRRREELRMFDTNSPPPSVVVSSQFPRTAYDGGDFPTRLQSPRQIGSARLNRSS